MKKGNLYYYFRNKEEILFACHQYSLDRLLAMLDEVERSGLAPDEKLRRLIVASCTRSSTSCTARRCSSISKRCRRRT